MRTIVCIGLIVMTTFPAVAGLGAGDSAVVRGEYRLAIDEYQETLDANPDHVRALYSIARAETLLAETLSGNEAEMYFANAAAHARQAIAGDDSDPEGYFELARVLGRLAQLRGCFRRSISRARCGRRWKLPWHSIPATPTRSTPWPGGTSRCPGFWADARGGYGRCSIASSNSSPT